MNLQDLGYSEKWVNYGLLTSEILNKQLAEYQIDQDQNTEHYRYGTFKDLLSQKKHFTNLEISQFIGLIFEDSNELMAGSALKELFIHTGISDEQFDLIKIELSKFGDWTNKIIQREELKKKIESEDLSEHLINKCINHKNQFSENALIELIIDKANNIELIHQFSENDFGKRIRNLAKEKIIRLKKAGNKV